MACKSSGSGSNDLAFVSSKSMELAVAKAAAAAAAVVFFLVALGFGAVESPFFALARLLAAAETGTADVDAEAPSLPSAGGTTAGTFGGFFARIRKLGNASKCSPVL